MNWNTAPIDDFVENENIVTSTESDYSAFCRHLEKTSGITLGPHKSYLVQSRLKPIMEQYSFKALGELLQMLNNGKNLTLGKLVVDAMTTNETSWFRDEYPFEFLRDNILEKITMAQKKPFSIWSAACSYGHEPYSISMVVQEFLERNPGRIPAGLEIMATDISSRVLEQSTSGLYRRFDTERGLSAERKRKYFHEKDDRLQIRDDIRARVTFRKHNLITNSFPLGTFDAIFCRNVLIYFSNENKQQILRNMVKSLAPGGYLFLGGSEPMVNYSDKFDMVQYKRGVVHQLKEA